MQRAEGVPVVEIVWSAEGEPPDMRGLDTDRRTAELPVEAAEGALRVLRR